MKQKILYISVAFLLIFIAPSLWIANYFFSPSGLAEKTTIVFAPNTRFTEIADQLAEKKVISYPFLFKIILFTKGDASKFKAGEYAFSEHISPKEVANMFINGKTIIHHLTVIEGMLTAEVLELIKNNEALAGDIILDIKEGELLPETYNFSRGDKRNDLIMRMRHQMQKTLKDAWEGRAENLPFNAPEQALTLASIVEKETGINSERSRVAAVYINRLRKNMLLQADPTTAYAVTSGKHKLERPLNYNDLAINSPYNTYRVLGLPPAPISNPGKASIIAALHPLISNEIYFVATGNGGHNFAATLEEHNKNVKKYRERNAQLPR